MYPELFFYLLLIQLLVKRQCFKYNPFCKAPNPIYQLFGKESSWEVEQIVSGIAEGSVFININNIFQLIKQ